VSKQTHDSIMAQIEAPSKNALDRQDKKSPPGKPSTPPDTSTIAGLLLGSPEFQKR
jgi:hypothetical protein